MLLVKTVLKQSPIHGIGVFADEHIVAGSMIGMWQEGLDLTLDYGYVNQLAEPLREAIRHYAYLDAVGGEYKLNADNMRFFNHSDDPNTHDSSDFDYASRDIERGEELTCNYYRFDAEAARKLEV